MSSYQYLQTKGMNTEVFPPNTPRYQRLAKPKTRIDQTSNFNAFKVKRGALNYQITESLNKLAQPKRQPGVNLLNVSSSPSKTVPPSTVKQGYYKLINSSEQSKDAQESQKKKFLLDTYARITATRNRNCSKRLNELAKPKRYPMQQTEAYGKFDNYFQTIKKYDPQSRPSMAAQRKN